MLAQRVSEWTSEWKQQGWVEGMEKGIESEKILLVRLIQRRFGYATSETAKIILKPIINTDTLEQIGDWIIDCNDGETLLSKLKAL